MKHTEMTTKSSRRPVELRLNELNLTRMNGEEVTCPICGKKHIKSDLHQSCCSRKCQEQIEQLTRRMNGIDRSRERAFNTQKADGKNYQKRVENFDRGIGFSFYH